MRDIIAKIVDCTTYFVRPQEYVSSVSFGSKKSFHLTVEVTLALCVAIVTQIPNILDRLRTGPLVEKEAKRPEGRGTPLFGLNGDVPLHRVWFTGSSVLKRFTILL